MNLDNTHPTTAGSAHQSGTEPTFCEWISHRQSECGLSDGELANQVGYADASVVRLIKRGDIRLPIHKVPDLAAAFEVDPGVVMRKLLSEASPPMLDAIERCVGPLALTVGEQRLIMALRASTGTPL